jgi:hypothetical protein
MNPILEFPAAWTGSMNRVCSYCGVFLGTKPCEPALDGQTSHGACPECAVKQVYPEIVRRIERADRGDLAHITLLELPQVDCDEHRLTLRQMAAARAEKLNA